MFYQRVIYKLSVLTAVLFGRSKLNHIVRLEFYDPLTLTLLFLPVLSVLLPLELFVYLRLIIGTLFLCISVHLTVLLLSNPVLNLIFLFLAITSSHSHASASYSTIDFGAI